MNNYNRYYDEIFELYEKHDGNKTQVSKEMHKKYFPESNPETVRRGVSKFIRTNEHTQLQEEVTTPHNVPLGQVSHYWDKTKNISAFIKVDAFDLLSVEERIENVVEKIALRRKPKKVYKKSTKKALIGTLTDEHVGMNPNPNNSAIFQYEYNAEIYQTKIDEYFENLIRHRDFYGTFDVLYLDNLGDRQDGLDGFTTRGGHELDQNMSNEQVFELCVESKVKLVEDCIDSGIAEKYVLVDISNDNHSGDFGLMVNLCVSKIINRIYDNSIIQCKILTRFIEPIEYGVHTFLKTHGKDKKYMKRGLPLDLTDKAINFFNEFIDHYNISGNIHVDKGDLHQIGYSRTKKFDYYNFMSFAPPSNWIQHNFGDSYAGYTIRVVDKESPEVVTSNYFLDYRKVG